MAELIREEKKLIVKLVYYGPALSGKTTNLMRLHDMLQTDHCGELMTFETKGDRTLFFDLLPLAVRSQSGFYVKFKLHTVPGQVAHDATRKTVLSRADGVIFVADSENSQAVSTFEGFENLENNAGRVGMDFDSLPLVIQFNKRDLPRIISEEENISNWMNLTANTGLTICCRRLLQPLFWMKSKRISQQPLCYPMVVPTTGNRPFRPGSWPMPART